MTEFIFRQFINNPETFDVACPNNDLRILRQFVKIQINNSFQNHSNFKILQQIAST